MGAHPKATSSVVVNDHDIPLDQWIAAHPQELLGQVVAARFNNGLPFLFKVLAAGEALSIQAHPNKDQAKLLRASDPAHYPDDNHKPEIAIAIDALTALMGIKPFAELAETLRRYPEIAMFSGSEVSARLTDTPNASPAQQQEITRQLLTAAVLARRQPHSSVGPGRGCIGPTPAATRGQALSEAEQLFVAPASEISPTRMSGYSPSSC